VCVDCPAELARDLDGAFGQFVAHHQDLVFGLALRWSGRRPQDAEDLAQDAFIRGYRALRGYDRERIVALRTRGWMARIVLNLARNRARDLGPAGTSLDPGANPAHDPADMDQRLQPAAVAERREAARAWTALLADLPPRYRAAVELRHVEGLSYREVAEALERPVNTVKSDVHRGVALLRAAWEAARQVNATEVAR
jgi:RNA polymerase sigma-70 factor (ECF subfamily)